MKSQRPGANETQSPFSIMPKISEVSVLQPMPTTHCIRLPRRAPRRNLIQKVKQITRKAKSDQVIVHEVTNQIRKNTLLKDLQKACAP